MSRPKNETTVISFRVSKELGVKIDKRAKKEKTKRAKLVESLFIPAFHQHITASKQPA